MGSRRRRRNRQDNGPALQSAIPVDDGVADSEVCARPTPLDIAHRIIVQFVVTLVCGVGGTVLAVVGVVLNIRSTGSLTSLIMALAGLLLLGLAWFLVRGGGLRWALRGVGLPLGGMRDDDARP